MMTTRTAAAAALPVLAVALSLAACADEAGRTDEQQRQLREPASSEVETSYAPELDVDLARMQRTDSGLRYRDLQVGDGPEVSAGQTVLVHYTGWLPGGMEFDTSRQRAPLDFTVGAGEVIAGWDEGIAGMRVGGRRMLVIPPALAYGNDGRGDRIPPGATLVFDVELIEIIGQP